MGSRLPRLSGKEAVKIFEKLGFVITRQKGSHIMMRKDNVGCVIPNHKQIKVGTLSGILKQAGIPNEIKNLKYPLGEI